LYQKSARPGRLSPTLSQKRLLETKARSWIDQRGVSLCEILGVDPSRRLTLGANQNGKNHQWNNQPGGRQSIFAAVCRNSQEGSR
jgi:hypothetical protein